LALPNICAKLAASSNQQWEASACIPRATNFQRASLHGLASVHSSQQAATCIASAGTLAGSLSVNAHGWIHQTSRPFNFSAAKPAGNRSTPGEGCVNKVGSSTRANVLDDWVKVARLRAIMSMMSMS